MSVASLAPASVLSLRGLTVALPPETGTDPSCVAVPSAATFLVTADSSSSSPAVRRPVRAARPARVGRGPIQNSPERESA